MKPMIKEVVGVINTIANAQEQNLALLNMTALNGETTIVVSSKEIAKQYVAWLGKVVSLSYDDCVAGETSYIDDDDASMTERYHETTHKSLRSCALLSPMALLLVCKAQGLMDLYPALLEMQKE